MKPPSRSGLRTIEVCFSVGSCEPGAIQKRTTAKYSGAFIMTINEELAWEYQISLALKRISLEWRQFSQAFVV